MHFVPLLNRGFFFALCICSHEAYYRVHNSIHQVNGVLSNELHNKVETCYTDTVLQFVEYQVSSRNRRKGAK